MLPAATDALAREWAGYLRARGLARIATGLALLLALTWFAGGRVLDLPSWPGVSAPLRASALLPVLYGLWAASCLQSRMAGLELHAARRLHHWDVALAAAAVVVALTPSLLVLAEEGGRQAGVTARNTLLWAGLALVLSRFVGQRRIWLVVLAAACALTVTGWDRAASPRAWAFPLHPYDSGRALASAALATALGLLCVAAPWRRRADR
ncbi:hypothetical protein ABZ953_34055 [Streptomyces sp. NPDC046465]|uniref:hypothetical protein n=1 Tax=Streptomyces sp. NPDC046465 TaxID=3155810 RepID=UPI0033EB3684